MTFNKELNIDDVLENMRYKYLDMKHHITMPPTQEVINELVDDMITISYALRVLINPFAEFKRIGEK